MPQPVEVLEWAKLAIPGVEIIKPPQNKIDIGWISQEKPPYQFFNWAFNLIGLWIEYLKEIGDSLGDQIKAVVPVGGVIGFADYGVGGITLPTEVYAYLNGQLINDPDSLLNGKTLEDASGRYLVGLGTDGGGNIGVAAWSDLAVGNAGHQINIQHSHTVNDHSHSMQAHTHTAAAHSHGPGTLKFRTAFRDDIGANNNIEMYDVNGVLQVAVSGTFTRSIDGTLLATGGVPDGFGTDHFYTALGEGVTANGGALATGGPSVASTGGATPGTNNQLSTTQSIQPRSVPVRWAIRYK